MRAVTNIPPSGATIDSPTFTGIAKFGDGTQAAPSIAFSTTPSIGLYLNSATIGALVAGNNNCLFWNTGGNVFTVASHYFGSAGDVGISRFSTASAGMVAGRFSYRQGAAVASANNLTLGTDGNYFQITGTTGINLIDNTGWQGGSVVTLKFNASLTVAHNTAASGNNKPILLAGAVGFSATANDTLTLRYDSTDAAWYEMSRAVI